MEAKICVQDVLFDSVENFNKAIEEKEKFKIRIFKSEIEEDDIPIESVGVFIESDFAEGECTLMFNLTKKNALFLAKSLMAMVETLED